MVEMERGSVLSRGRRNKSESGDGRSDVGLEDINVEGWKKKE